jgi:hypothetical protein
LEKNESRLHFFFALHALLNNQTLPAITPFLLPICTTVEQG